MLLEGQGTATLVLSNFHVMKIQLVDSDTLKMQFVSGSEMTKPILRDIVSKGEDCGFYYRRQFYSLNDFMRDYYPLRQGGSL